LNVVSYICYDADVVGLLDIASSIDYEIMEALADELAMMR